ncbi:TraR/DksA family transcriptional regulator (plasmid) [Pseudomonas cannabina pv. alisalensis]|uniref:RNA polymerase-binding protein DksA n=1 Tax=Pseudomonas syringae pv. maculicola str. ES4326 TaxID=629265 RepID=A0A8T8CA93_PSEYM|nr:MULTISPECIES: TraR/DksA family transcriptional regulator [Pseudomonas syringae group]QHF00459.1 RNA polymerase-binding protein DksA [Pseudomonas syringae pv. maculicola str. ES4326]UBZ00437.1 TraR/DksA family transcriptional regulator [Pseudomonas cannabina pv. alisalensis]
MVLDAAALLAQPNDSYMDAVQLQFFKQLLLKKQSELIDRIVGHEEAVSVTEKVADSSDAGTIEESRVLLMRILKGERAEAMAIKAALVRIDEDLYGWCEDSGEPIGLRRLLNNPTAFRTTEAQTRFERLGKHVRAEAV